MSTMSTTVPCALPPLAPGATFTCPVCNEDYQATQDGWRTSWELQARQEEAS